MSEGITHMTREQWEVLGIEQTKDEEVIVNAYRTKLLGVNPEDDQEGFMKLREAFENAMAYAKSEDLGEEEKKQDGPVFSEDPAVDAAIKEHIRKLNDIYSDFDKRRDENLWKEWAANPICRDLDSCDNMCEAVLVFLMRHFCLPNSAWKVLDATFSILDRKETLLEKFPLDYYQFLEVRIKEGDFVEYDEIYPREIYTEKFADLIPSIHIGMEDKQYESQKYDCPVDEYLFDVNNGISYYNDYYNNVLSNQTTPDQVYLDYMQKCIVCMSNIMDISEKQDLFNPEELGIRIMLLDLLGRSQDSLNLAVATLDRLSVVNYSASINAVKIICKYADQIPNLEELRPKMEEVVAKMEEVHPDYNATKKGRFCLLMLDKNYDEAEKVIMSALTINQNDMEGIVFFRNISATRLAEFEKKLTEGRATDKDKVDAAFLYYNNMNTPKALSVLDMAQVNDEVLYDYTRLYARCYYDEGEYEKALPYLMKWADLLDDMDARKDTLNEKDLERVKAIAQCNSRVAVALAELGRPEEAENYFKKSVATATKGEDNYFRCTEAYGKFLHKQNRVKEAMPIWEEMIDDPRYSLMGLVHRQEAAYKTRNAQQVLDDYYDIVKQYDRYAMAYYYAADVFGLYDRYDDAMKIIEAGKEAGLDSAMLRLVEARILKDASYEKQDKVRADHLYQEIYEKIQNNSEVNPCDAMDYLETVYTDAAYFYLNYKDAEGRRFCLDKAEFYMNKGLEADPKSWSMLFFKTDLEEVKRIPADDTYRQVILYYPDYPKAYFEYAEYLKRRCRSGDRDEAIRLFLKVLEMDPEYPEINHRLMKLNMQKFYANYDRLDWQLYRNAEYYATKQLEQEEEPYYYLERGFIYYGGGEPAKAIADAEKALELDEEDLYAYNLMGKCYYDMKNYAKSVECLKKAIELSPEGETAAPYNNIIRSLETVGQLDEAIFYVNEYNRIYGRDEESDEKLIRIYLKKRDYANALQLENQTYKQMAADFYGEKRIGSPRGLIDKLFVAINHATIAGDNNAVAYFESELNQTILKNDIKMNLLEVKTLGNKDSSKYPTYAHIYEKFGEYYLFTKRDFKNAAKFFKMSLDLTDIKSDVSFCMNIFKYYCNALHRIGKHKEAEKQARYALDLCVETFGTLNEYMADQREAAIRCNIIGQLLYFIGDVNGAYNTLNCAHNCIFCNFCTHYQCYDTFLAQGIFKELEGDIPAAIANYQQAMVLAPDDVEEFVALRALGAMQ